MACIPKMLSEQLFAGCQKHITFCGKQQPLVRGFDWFGFGFEPLGLVACMQSRQKSWPKWVCLCVCVCVSKWDNPI